MQLNSNVIFKFNGSFLNGQGNTRGKISTTQVKQYQDEGTSLPYISAQAYRKWMRNSLSESLNTYDYFSRLSRTKTKKEYEKLVHVEGDPIKYLEDDLMGHSKPFINNVLDSNLDRLDIASSNRHSPLGVTAITPVDKELVNIDTMEGFVHLASDTPLPYRNEFSYGFFQSIVNLDINRIGSYTNQNDLYELDKFILEKYLKSGEIVEESNNSLISYQLKNVKDRKIEASRAYFDLLLNTYPDVKISQFATDISPRLIISGLLNDASSLLSNMVESDTESNLKLNYGHLKELISNRGHKLVSDLFIGYRSGFFNEEREEELLSFDGKLLQHKNGDIEIHVISPGEVRNKLLQQLEEELN